MKNIILILACCFLSLGVIANFSYADNKSDIEIIYSNKISSIESQMNKAYSDLEGIYTTSISNAEARLKDANDILRKIQENYSLQIDIAINSAKSSGLVLSESELKSIALDSVRGIKTQVDAQEKIVTQITAQIKSLQDEKSSKLIQVKSQYQAKIDTLIAERNSLIASLVIQPSEGQANSANNSSQLTIYNNNPIKTVTESNKLKCPVNSYDIYNGNSEYVSCKCNQSFEYNSSGVCTYKNESIEENCKAKHGGNSLSISSIKGGTECICNSGYVFNSNKICITEKEKFIEDSSLIKNTPTIIQETNVNNRNSESYPVGQIQTSISNSNNQDYTRISPSDKFDYFAEGIMKVKEFRKSKLLKINSKFEVGATIAVYKMDGFGYGSKVGRTIVGRKGQIRFSVNTPGKYKFLLNNIQY